MHRAFFGFKNTVIASALVMASMASPSDAANILVFGDRPGDQAQLTSDLISLGHTVTNRSTLGTDLSGFDTIWDLQIFSGLSSSDQASLRNFISSGGGVHFTGERPCCEAANDSIQAILNSLVIGGGITVGDQGDVVGPYSFNANAIDGVGVGLGTWLASASGGVTGIGGIGAPSNVLTTNSAGQATGALWNSSDLLGNAGAITLLMDVNWFSNGGNRVAQIGRIQAFLESGAAVAPVPVPAALPLFASVLGLGGLLGWKHKRKAMA